MKSDVGGFSLFLTIVLEYLISGHPVHLCIQVREVSS